MLQDRLLEQEGAMVRAGIGRHIDSFTHRLHQYVSCHRGSCTQNDADSCGTMLNPQRITEAYGATQACAKQPTASGQAATQESLRPPKIRVGVIRRGVHGYISPTPSCLKQKTIITPLRRTTTRYERPQRRCASRTRSVQRPRPCYRDPCLLFVRHSGYLRVIVADCPASPTFDGPSMH